MRRVFATIGLVVSLAFGCASRQAKYTPGLEPHHSRMESSEKIVRKAVEADDTSTVWNWFKSPWARKSTASSRL